MSRSTGAAVAVALGLSAMLGCNGERTVSAPRTPPEESPRPNPLPADEASPPKPLPAEVVAAWEKAGAEMGWMTVDKYSFIVFRTGGEGKEGEIPAFHFAYWRMGIVSQLPLPGQAFGLDLASCQSVTDGGLKELAGLTQLRGLRLASCNGVTDAGVKALAGLTLLRGLDLRDTQVTDECLKELAGLCNYGR